MKSTIEDCLTEPFYSQFELFECAMMLYLGAMDRAEIVSGLDGPNDQPRLFRSKVIEALSRAKEYLPTPQGQEALKTLRNRFTGTQGALDHAGLSELG